MVENALKGAGRRVDYSHVRLDTFTTPSLAPIQLTDAQVPDAGHICTCRVLALSHRPWAIFNCDTRAVAKLVDEIGTSKVVGLHIAAANACEAILATTHALKEDMTSQQLATTWAR